MITGGWPEAISPVEGTSGDSNSTTMSDNTNSSRNVPKTSNRSVYFDQFLEINCSYLSPNNLDDTFLSKENSEFVIYHNNIRSINKNIKKVNDVFLNCTKYPDILAFSDTQIKENSLMPKCPFEGYHDFEFTPNTRKAGGVGFFLKETFDFELIPDLKMNLRLCEDIWLKVKNFDNPNLDKKGLIIGVIYQHGQKYEKFYEKLCERLTYLNAQKQKYILVGDFNLDLMKYNIATAPTNSSSSRFLFNQKKENEGKN